MSQTVKAANAHTAVTTGWTNPSNAYATATDLAYATAAPAKNATIDGDFGFPAFTTGEIPAHATIQSVIVRTTWLFTVSVTGGTLGMQLRRNSTGTTLGSETTAAPLIPTDASQTGTGATLTDLRTANEIRARMRATKGNTSTGTTGELDRVYLEVNWVETITAAAGTITPTVTMTAAGTKKTSGAASLTATASFAEIGKKATSGAAGVLSPSLTLAEVGKKGASGAGNLGATASLNEAGRKQASDVGALTLSASFALDGLAAGSSPPAADVAAPTVGTGKPWPRNVVRLRAPHLSRIYSPDPPRRVSSKCAMQLDAVLRATGVADRRRFHALRMIAVC